MTIRALEFATVIVASDCNPTIVNPDFLARQNIVPDEWGWKVSGPAITTPPFSSVTYDSGVSVLVEQNKFQVVDNLTDRAPDASQAPEVARNYIQILPHVRYTAVGHNIKGFAERVEAESFLKIRFLKSGVWDSDSYPLERISLTFAYPLQGCRLNLSLAGASVLVRSGNESRKVNGILVQANYHRECEGYPSHEQVIGHLGNTIDDWNHFQSIASDILG